jgi:O-antigen/teichoic acid export membrane protein
VTALAPPPATARVARQAAGVFAGRIGAQAVAVVTTVLLARRLGAGAFGDYALAASVVMVANVATTFGSDMVLVRAVAATRDVRRWADALVVQVILSALALVVILVGAAALPASRRGAAGAACVLAVSLFPAAAFNVATAVVRGVGRLGTYAGLGVLAATGPLVAVATAPAHSTVTALAVRLTIAQFVVAAVTCVVVARRVPVSGRRSRPTRRSVVGMARESTAVGGMGVVGIVYQRLAVLVLGVGGGPTVGWFAASGRVVEAAKTGPVSWFTALLPSMAAARPTGPDDGAARRRARAELEVTVGLGVAITIALVVAGPWLVARLYGAGYAPAGTVVRLLALAVVPSTLATHLSMRLLVAHRERDALRVLLVVTLLLGGLLAALVPSAHARGAAIAVVLAEAFHALLLARLGARPPAMVGGVDAVLVG